MSFDINQSVFDSKGTYLEEQAVRYEQALMDQFAASPEGQAITHSAKWSMKRHAPARANGLTSAP